MKECAEVRPKQGQGRAKKKNEEEKNKRGRCHCSILFGFGLRGFYESEFCAFWLLLHFNSHLLQGAVHSIFDLKVGQHIAVSPHCSLPRHFAVWVAADRLSSLRGAHQIVALGHFMRVLFVGRVEAGF